MTPEGQYGQEGQHGQVSERGGTAAGVVGGSGSSIEAAGGVAALALAIVGLAGVIPLYMVSIAAIVVGGALLLEGIATAGRFAQAAANHPESLAPEAEVGGGVTTEFLGGIAGVVLGILAILGVGTLVLVAVAAIVFGGALLIGSGASMAGSLGTGSANPMDRAAAIVERQTASATASAAWMIGIASIVLGIIAVCQVQPQILTLVAMLILGAGFIFSGSALTGRLVGGMMRPRRTA